MARNITSLPYITQEEERKLKPFPFFEGGVNENATIRMIRMVKPECPIDPNPEIKQPDGSMKANPRYTGEDNCMQVFKLDNYGHWAVLRCEALGHDPYFSTRRTPLVEETVDDDGYITETKTRYRKQRVPNIVPVSDNIRHSSGKEIERARGKGYKFLWECGYQSPCEFRACSRSWNIETQYGRYCSERHARLIGAEDKLLILGSPAFRETAEETNEYTQDHLDAILLDERRETIYKLPPVQKRAQKKSEKVASDK